MRHKRHRRRRNQMSNASTHTRRSSARDCHQPSILSRSTNPDRAHLCLTKNDRSSPTSQNAQSPRPKISQSVIAARQRLKKDDCSPTSTNAAKSHIVSATPSPAIRNKQTQSGSWTYHLGAGHLLAHAANRRTTLPKASTFALPMPRSTW